MGQLCLCLIIEKAPAVRSELCIQVCGSSELRSLVYYVVYLNIGLINFNLFQKNILRFYSEDLVFGSGELSFTGILHVKLAARVNLIKIFFYFNCVYYIIHIIEKTLLNLFQRAVLYIILLKIAERCNLLHRYITYQSYLSR